MPSEQVVRYIYRLYKDRLSDIPMCLGHTVQSDIQMHKSEMPRWPEFIE
jgi:hypothetical protein